VIDVIEKLRASREAVLAAAQARGLTDVRIFGSAARGEPGETSDVDLLVHPGASSSVFELAGFMAEVEEIFGARVDVLSDRGRGPVMERVRAEAVPSEPSTDRPGLEISAHILSCDDSMVV
jgi:predicted nucleotidyltransferase